MNLTDEALIRLVAAGDETAFTTLFRRRQGPIYRFALHMTGCPSIADDVTQEVFLALLRQARQYDPERGSVSAYLFGIARHQVLRHLGQPRFEALDDQLGPQRSETCRTAGGDPLRDLTRNETIEAVRQAVLALPAHYREVVVLCDLQELEYREAAKLLAYPVGTVRSRLHRGRNLLLKRLQGAAQSATGRLSAASVP